MKKVHFCLYSLQNEDDNLNVGIDSIVAIPLDKWSLDYVTPQAQCVRKDGECLQFSFSDPPDQSVVLPYVGPTRGQPADKLPPALEGTGNAQLLYVDKENPIVDITGAVPQPGYYVLVANYHQPGPSKIYSFILKLNF